MLEQIWRQLEEGGGAAPPDVVASGQGPRRLSKLLEGGGGVGQRSLRQEQMFQPRLSLSSFVGSEAQQPRSEQEQEGSLTPQRSSTPGDIITIEDSEAEGPSPRGGAKDRRKSRLAANFSGSEH